MKYIITLAFLLIINSLQAQFYQQYFDGGDTIAGSSLFINLDSSTGIWQVGAPSKSILNSPHSAPNSLMTDTLNTYPALDSSQFHFTVGATWFWGIVAYQWTQSIDFEEISDGGLIEFSVDSGDTWENAFTSPYVYNFFGFDFQNVDTLSNGKVGFTGTDSLMRNVWLCLDASWLSLQDSVRFRFTLVSDSVDNSNEGWLLDNMKLSTTIIHTLNEKELEEYMQVYPNPTNGVLNIRTQKINDFHIIEHMQLFNSEGKLIEEYENIPTKFSLNIKNHPKGTYYLHVKTNIKTEKFTILLED